MFDGYKSKIAGIGGILSGLAMIASALTKSPIDWNEVWQGVLVVIGGLGILGVTGKMQKLIDK